MADVRASLVAMVGLGLAACTYPKLIPPPDADPNAVYETVRFPLTINPDLDILFLIDDSPSMADKQKNLTTAFPALLSVLSTVEPPGLPNLHLGVVTSDLGTKGAADASPGPGLGTLGQGGCMGVGKAGNLQLFGAPVTGGLYISDIATSSGTRLTNYTAGAQLTDVFGTMAKAGAGGCGFEQHLEAIKQALQPTNTVNQGFLRDSAALAIVILADEDDCSMAHSSLLEAGDVGPLGALQSFRCTRFGIVCDDGGATTDAMNMPGPKAGCHPDDSATYLTRVADYATFLNNLKRDPNQLAVAAIAGPTAPFTVETRAPPMTTTELPALAHSCMYTDSDGKPEVADPPVRIKSLLDQFPGHSTLAPICGQDLTAPAQQVGHLLKALISDPCINGELADADPTLAGLQPDCTVSAVDAGASTAIPHCTADNTNPPCWRFTTDAPHCPDRDHLALRIEGAAALPTTTRIEAQCRLAGT